MLSRGTTFLWKAHVWFNITEPTARSPEVLCVNLTHLDDECPDDECTISNAEYAFVKAGYPTVVAFSRAKIWDANKIEGCLKNGLFPKPYQGDIPHQTIDKIAKAALDSKELSAKAKSLIR